MPRGVTSSSETIGDVIHIFKNTLVIVSNSNSKSSRETVLLLTTNWTKVLELADSAQVSGDTFTLRANFKMNRSRLSSSTTFSLCGKTATET